MRVLKFGGTSMGSAQSINSVKSIILEYEKPVCAVVSAVSGITDKLLQVAQTAVNGDDYTVNFNAIYARHEQIVNELFADPKPVMDALAPIFAELNNLLNGVCLLKELSPRSLDAISGFGERFSSLILHKLIDGSKLLIVNNI